MFDAPVTVLLCPYGLLGLGGFPGVAPEEWGSLKGREVIRRKGDTPWRCYV